MSASPEAHDPVGPDHESRGGEAMRGERARWLIRLG